MEAIYLLLPDGTLAQIRGDASGYLLVAVATSAPAAASAYGEEVNVLLADGTQQLLRGDANGCLILAS